jgi:hypothetical protein
MQWRRQWLSNVVYPVCWLSKNLLTETEITSQKIRPVKLSMTTLGASLDCSDLRCPSATLQKVEAQDVQTNGHSIQPYISIEKLIMDNQTRKTQPMQETQQFHPLWKLFQ